MILTWPSQERRNLYQKNLILTPPKKHFFKRKSFSHPPRFLYLSEKLISCTFPKKLKRFEYHSTIFMLEK